MGTLKSRTAYEAILTALTDDLQLSSKDREYLVRRLTCESESFLLNTLPLLAKAIESGLSSKRFIPPDGFKRYHHNGKTTNLTCLFKEKLALIFDDEGNFRESADPREIAYLVGEMRQVCYAFNKIVYEFTDQQLNEAEEKFLAIDDQVKEDFSTLSTRDLTILSYAKTLISAVTENIDLKKIIPRHGNGASAEKLTQAERRRYNNLTFYGGLHERYPYYTYFLPNTGSLNTFAAHYWAAKARGANSMGISRLACVPKDARGPRIICIEPHEYMWIQQGQMMEIYRNVENHRLTAGYVNFTDQTINQRLAWEGSVFNDFSTLDLKDASDLVSCELVKRLFSGSFLKDILSTRTGKVYLPNKKYVRFLKKYASMGNALCFPIEALTFWALSQATLRYYGLSGKIYVYGDDIIVPKEATDLVKTTLYNFGLRVNQEKSFSEGLFRESCGKDYVAGIEVTPTRIRRLDMCLESLLSLRDTADQFFEKGYWKVAKVCENFVQSICKEFNIRVGFTADTCGSNLAYRQFFTKCDGVAYISDRRVRYNQAYQRHEVLLPVISGNKKAVEWITDEEALLQKLTHGWKSEVVPEIYKYSVSKALVVRKGWCIT